MRAFDNRTYNKLKFNSVGSDESDLQEVSWVYFIKKMDNTMLCESGFTN